jgi:hypothetical protein
MAEQELSNDTIKSRHFNWPRLAIVVIGLVIAFALVIWFSTALTNCKRPRAQPAAMPEAYLLPVYVQR